MSSVGFIGVGTNRRMRRKAIGSISPFTATVAGLTNNPTFGPTAQISVTLTGSISGLTGGETIVHRWLLGGVPIAGADGDTYSPIVAQDTQSLRYSPTVDGEAVNTSSYTIRRIPPVAGALAAVNETVGSGQPTVNLAAGFTGNGLLYTSDQPWATVPLTGSVLTILDELRDDTVTIAASNSGGSATVDLSVTIAERPAATLYVSSAGNDTTGDGSEGSPFRQVTSFVSTLVAGDTVTAMDDGPFNPFTITSSGTPSNPIRFNAANGANPQVVGDLLNHTALGGTGAEAGNAFRDGVFSSGNSHIEFDSWTSRDCWRNGFVFFGATPGSPATGITLRSCVAYRVGASPFRFEGQNSDTLIAASEDGAPRLTGVLQEDCVGYWGNIPNDRLTADTETFSWGNGVDGVVCRRPVSGTTEISTVYGDPITGRSRGYGYDVKVGAKNVLIEDPLALNHTKNAYYLDSGRLWLDGISLKNPRAYNCEIGLVIAREAATVNETFQESYDADNAAFASMRIDGIDVINPQFWSMDKALVFLDAHPRDNTATPGVGSINDVRIRFLSGYNGRRVSGSDMNLLDWETLAVAPTNVEVIGIALWNDEGSVTFAESMASLPSWLTYDDNLTASDPLFTDPANGDFSLQSGSPAENFVTGYNASPFNLDANGDARGNPGAAGAYIGDSEVADVSAPITIDASSYVASGSGNDPSITHTLTYGGGRTLTAYGAFVDSASGDPSAAQLEAGSGAGIIEGSSQVLTIPSSGLELTGFTSSSETADEFHYFIKESGNSPQSSLIEILTATGIDFSPATVQSAATDSTDGSTWTLTFDEAVYGTGTAGDWTLGGAAGATISSVTINSTTSVVINVGGTLPTDASTLTISYSGGDLRDVDGNTIADIVAQSVTNNVPAVGGFTETGVVLDGSQFYVAESLPTGQASFLMMGSLICTGNTRMAFMDYDSYDGGCHVDNVSGNGLCGVRVEMFDNGTDKVQTTDETITNGTRYHFLWSIWREPAALRHIVYIYDTSTSTWTEARNDTEALGVGTELVLSGADPMALFARNGSTGSHRFAGTVYRAALWTSPSTAAIADITSASVRNNFTNGSSIADPSISQTAYAAATLHVDLNGSVADWNAGTHGGDMTLLKTGTFA